MPPLRKYAPSLIVAGLALLCSTVYGGAVPLLRPEIETFIEEMGRNHAYEPGPLRRLFSQVQTRPAILRAMYTPGTARPWHEFRRRIVEPSRIERGLRFWFENIASLERARREFGIPEELVVATIGIETMYGRNTGNFRVVEALATLAFDYPPRAEFFRAELEEYLLLARDSGLDAGSVRGSYAGAIGLPQFLPSSYRKYAVDFDGDGRRDLLNSAADAIGSVANYYYSFGWKTGQDVIVPIERGDADIGALIAAGIRPHATVGDLRKRGLLIQPAIQENAEAAVFSVETEAGPRLYLGLTNFYVITRYNRSVNYAMAVHELAGEIRAQMRTGAPPDAKMSLDR